MPGARCARSRAWWVESTRVSHHGHTGNTRHSPRNGFTAYFALSRVTGLSCHPRRWICIHPLDASVGASGPHDFAVRLGAVRQKRRRVHRIPPRVRDDREPPLCVGRDGGGYRPDSDLRKIRIFLQRGLDRLLVICPSGSPLPIRKRLALAFYSREPRLSGVSRRSKRSAE